MATQKRVGLGRGLGAIIPNNDSDAGVENNKMVSISSVSPNPRQPRTIFRIEDLEELADSIKEHGIIQPLIVSQENEDKYTIIAGERRLRAAELAGLSMVPVIIRQASDQEMLELALIENVQREDLSPLETAEAYQNLEESFNLTHEEIAKRVGKQRTSVTNTLRLLKLPESIREALATRQISEGHARCLLSLETEDAQNAALQQILSQNLNVRQTEELVRKLSGTKTPAKASKSLSPEMKSIEEDLMNTFGTKVTLHPGKNGGTIHIHYYSDEELETLLYRFK